MMKKTTALLAILVPLCLSACEIKAGNGTPKATTGYATGTVLDTQGKPIAGAKILLDNSVYYASYIHGSTKEDGSYRIKAQPGAWRAEASLKKEYNGKTYTLELHPDSIDSFDDRGAVRNFVWKLEGRTPKSDYGYYGGFIQLRTDLDFNGDLENVELTLTPSGPLIDGSQGKTLRLRHGDHYWVDRYQIEDIPIGRYTVEATLKSEEGSRRLRIQDWYTRGDFQSGLQLDFTPNPGSGTRNSASIAIGD